MVTYTRMEMCRLVSDFQIQSADIDETPAKAELPRDYAKRMAREKAEAVRRARKLARKKAQREGML